MSFDILYDVLKKYEYDDGVKDVVIPYGVRSMDSMYGLKFQICTFYSTVYFRNYFVLLTMYF